MGYNAGTLIVWFHFGVSGSNVKIGPLGARGPQGPLICSVGKSTLAPGQWKTGKERERERKEEKGKKAEEKDGEEKEEEKKDERGKEKKERKEVGKKVLTEIQKKTGMNKS